MMHLEPTHKLLVGVNGASMASVPVAIILFLFLALVPKNAAETGRAVSPPLPASTVPVPSVTSNDIVVPVEQSRVAPREAPRQRHQAVAAPKRLPVERVLYSARWAGGEVRRKIAGNMPQYPAGFSGEAMVRAELVVSAAGNVRSAKLLQIGNAHCDEAALREVRLWKFQPLPPRQKRVDQRCVVIMSFTRK
jgi:TonB family protein